MAQHSFASPSFIPVAEDRLLTPSEAAERLGLHTETLKRYRKATSPTLGPRYVRLNDRVVRYRLSDLLAFVAHREADGEAPRSTLATVGSDDLTGCPLTRWFAPSPFAVAPLPVQKPEIARKDVN